MTGNPASEHEISLLDILDFIRRHAKILIGTTLAAGVISTVVALLLPNVYTATVRMVFPADNAIPAGQVKTVIESGALAEEMVRRFSLAQAFGVGTDLEARSLLAGVTRIKDKDGVITIEVDDHEPARAALLANAYPEELDKRIRALGLSSLARKRVLAELRLNTLGVELAKTKAALREVMPASLGDAYILERQIVADNLNQLRAGLDLIGEDPAALPARKEIDAINARLELLKEPGITGSGGRTVAEKEYLLRYGQAKYLEALTEHLQRRLATFRAEESAYGVRIVDPAITPTEKSKPRRTLIVLAATLATAFLTIMFLLMKEAAGGLRRQAD